MSSSTVSYQMSSSMSSAGAPPSQPQKHGKSGETGIQPLAAGTGSLALSNSSVSPGPLWFEFSLSAALALTVGANTVTANLPKNGAGYLLPYFDRPVMAVAYAVTPAPIVPDEATLPVPQSTKKLLGSTPSPMPAGSGITGVTVTPGPPATVTINITASAAGTIPIGTRFLVFTVQGV